MKSTQLVVLERNTSVEGILESEPYEAGWATEAIWFVEALDPLSTRWNARLQISPDGLRWCDHESEPHFLVAHGLTAISAGTFGNWVRVVLESANDTAAPGRFMLTLVLK